MSDLQEMTNKALQRSLQPGASKKGKARKSCVDAKFPKDIADLLVTFLDNIKEVREIRDKLPDTESVTEHNEVIGAVLQNTLALRKTSDAAFSSAELRLYQSHVSLAVVTDVGRMVFQTRVVISPEQLSQFIAFSTAKPPPLALARKLKSIYEKMQRLRVSIDQTCSLAEDVERRRLAPPSFDSYTSADISALLTDIDNQFVLVQRRIAYLRGEFATIEPVKQKERESDTELTYTELTSTEASLEYALVGLNIGSHADTDTRTDSDTHGYDSYEYPQCSTPRVTKEPVRLEPHSASPDIHNNTNSASAYKDKLCEAKIVLTPWDYLRASIKQAKRPNYSFELYEQMTDAAPSSPPASGAFSLQTAQSPAKRGQSFRQFSSAYRHLRGSHNTSAAHNHLVEEAAAVAVAQFNSPASKSASKRADAGAVPFVTSPNWQLAANSPGDWRHIRGATSGVAKTTSTGTRAPAPAVAGFGANYNSPLVGVLDHISKYAERQPKLPPPAAPSATLGADAAPIVAGSNFKKPSEKGIADLGIGMRRERGSNVSDDPAAPKSRSASQDFTKPTFAPSLGMFGSAAPSTAGVAEKLNFGSKSIDRADSREDRDEREDESPSFSRKKPSGSFGSSATAPAPSLLTPSTAGSPSSATGSAAQSSPGGVVASLLTVPEISKQLHDIYAKYVPEKLADVPKLLTKYAGREKELLEKAIKKYGPLDMPVSSPTAATSKTSSILGMPPTSPSGVRPRQGSGSVGGADDQPRSRGASIVSGGTSLFGPESKPSTGFGPATLGSGAAPGAAPTSPFGGTGTGSLFGKPTVPATAGAATAGAGATIGTGGAGGGAGGAGGAGASPFGSPAAAAPAAGIGSLFGKPAAAAVPTPAAPVEDPVLQRVTSIYTQHNPSKLAEIPQLMDKYKGRELQLIANLEKKYNVPHVPLPTPAAPAVSATTSVFGGGGGTAPTGSVFGNGSGTAQPTGFGGGSSLFGKPAATATPTPFGNANSAAAPATSAGASPFGTVAAAGGIPSPFGGATASPFGPGAAAATPSPFGTTTAPAAGGTGSLFGSGSKPAAVPSTGFGQPNANQGTAGLFGGSAGVGGASSPFTNTGTAGAGTGGLFGSKGVAGNASPSPFASNTTQNTGSLFSPAAAQPASGGSPFASGFNTPLGKASAPAGNTSMFQQNTSTGLGSMGGMGLGGGSTGIGGTTSPGLFGRPAATPGGGGSLFGGGGGGGGLGTSTGFGGAPAASGGSLFGGGGGGMTAAPALNSLSNINQVQQRVTAIYTQHNPSKLAEIPQLMEKYRGRELQLIANLEKKYNIDSSGGGGGGGAMMTNGGGQSTGFGSFGGNNNNNSGAMSTGFGGQQSGTGGLFGGGGGGGMSSMGGGMGATSTGFGGMNQNNATTSPGGGSLFGRPAGAAAGTGGSSLFGGGGGGGMSGGIASGGMGATQTGFGGGQASGGSVFGRPSGLGGNNTSTGFGSMGSMGGGGLFGGGGGNSNSMWGNR